MQRNFSDIVADIDFLVRGFSDEVTASDSSSRQQPTEAAGKRHEILTQLARTRVALDHAFEEGSGITETRVAWLRRQQDLIDSLADEITRNALESCRALQLADANANVSALCEYRDVDLRKLLAEVTRRGEQLKNRLARDRACSGFGADEGVSVLQPERQSGTLAAPREISKNPLDHDNGEMF